MELREAMSALEVRHKGTVYMVDREVEMADED